ACNRLESEKELAKEEQERLEKLEGLNSHETSSSKADDYDIIVRQLAFEAKATACNRLKSEKELAKEEQERLEKLELKRQRRMKGFHAVDAKPKHVSADDLGDSFTPAEDNRVLLSYPDTSVWNIMEGKLRRQRESCRSHSQDQLTIIERIKTCNNPNTTPQNKPKMETFFAILLAYFSELSTMGSEEMKLVDKLSRQLFDIAQYSPVNSAKHMQQIVKDIQERFAENRDRRGGKGMFPDLSELLNLRVVSMLFSASDFKHVVCTPAILLLSQVLAQIFAPVKEHLLRLPIGFYPHSVKVFSI
ncbi:Nucleolar protein 14, partial [Acropora cervicornis]